MNATRPMSRPSLAARLAAGLLLLSVGCTAPPEDPGSSRRPVVFGELEPDEPGTVRIVAARGSGSSCSASLVGSSLLLTANHCVDGSRPSDWIVQVGQMAVTDRSIRVVEVVTPGPFLDDSEDDIALLVLEEPLDLPVYVAAYDLPDPLLYTEVKIVGYGLDEHSGSGVRKSTTMGVVSVADLWLRLAGDGYPGSGDSGGPVLDGRGHVVGVISRGGPRIGIVTRVDAHRWLLDQYLRAHGGCVPGDPERCDGVDNDCNGEVDEGCARAGEPCSTADECTTGLCAVVSDARVCTSPCVPGAGRPCPVGTYCMETACREGLCRPGAPGQGADGEPCEDDLDCEGLSCRDPGTGSRRCARPCLPDTLACGEAETCLPLGDGCGACFVLEAAPGPRGLGERCGRAADCRSGDCLDDPPTRYCTADCAEGCPAAMHCRQGRCARGPLGEVGDPCLVDDDCASELCWTSPQGPRVCTAPCGETRTWCPPRASCDFAARVCVPVDLPLASHCDPTEPGACGEADCVAIDGEARCARPCDEPCPAAFECRTADDGSRRCWPLPSSQAPAGCGCRAPGQAPRTSRGATALLLALVRDTSRFRR